MTSLPKDPVSGFALLLEASIEDAPGAASTETPIPLPQTHDPRSLFASHDATNGLNEDSALWSHVIEHSGLGMAVSSAEFDRLVMVNPAYAAMHGQSVHELAGSSMIASYAEDVQATLPEHFRIAQARGNHSFESVHQRIDGSTFPVFVAMTCVKDPQAQVLYCVSNVQDITERRKIEVRLAHENDLLSALMDNLPDAICIKDLEMSYVWINRAAATFMGYESPADAVGKSDFDYFPDAQARRFFEDEQRVIATGEPLVNNLELKRSAGDAWRSSLTSRVPIRDRADRIVGLVSIARDYTELKEAEDIRARLAAIVESANDAIVSTTLDGVVSSWNPGAERVYGYTAAESVGRPFAPMVLAPGNEAEMTALLDRVARGERVTNYETTRLTKDRQLIDVLLTVAPIASVNGEILGAATISNDVTERKQAEAALTAANQELEAFSSSVSHDLRAPLRIVDGFSRILVEDYGELLPDEAKRVLMIVRTGALQMGQLIDDLLAFSRLGRQPLRLRDVNPAIIVNNVIDEMASDFDGRSIEITIDELPSCQADPALLKQVFVNLIGNALKYSRSRCPSIIQIGALPVGSGAREQTFFVKDNGVGFNMAYASTLFSVFQRLHRAEDYEGTGVGLALVQRIVHRHGGRVWADALVDHGATFWFTLPATEAFDRGAVVTAGE